MALQDVTVPYEFLVRFDADGSVQGAHYIKRRIVVLDDQVLSDTALPPEPFSGLSPADMDALRPVCDGVMIALLTDNERLRLILAEASQSEPVEASPETVTETPPQQGLFSRLSTAVRGILTGE